jgi:hypothetical protein
MRDLIFPQSRISGIGTNMTMTPVKANVNACNQSLIKLLESPDRVSLGRRGRWYGRGAARGYYVLHQRVGLWICRLQPVSTQDMHLELGLPLFTEQPRRVLLGNWAAGTDISRRAVDKVYGYVVESDDGEPSRRAEEALTPAIPRSQERTKILRGG